MKDFWENWKHKTKLEIAAIQSLKQAKRIILENIPKSKIVAIYVGGSFIRREMIKKSDVDTWTIVSDNNLLKRFDKLKECRLAHNPPISLSGWSLWELKEGKRYLKPSKEKMSPYRFIKRLRDYILIYGKPLDLSKFKTRSDKEDLKSLIGAFNKKFFPLYEQGKFGFSEILNQIFWVVELEQKIKGKKTPYSWKKLEKSIKDKNHIIHDTLRFRVKRIKDKKKRARFIIRLKHYLKDLEKELK